MCAGTIATERHYSQRLGFPNKCVVLTYLLQRSPDCSGCAGLPFGLDAVPDSDRPTNVRFCLFQGRVAFRRKTESQLLRPFISIHRQGS